MPKITKPAPWGSRVQSDRLDCLQPLAPMPPPGQLSATASPCLALAGPAPALLWPHHQHSPQVSISDRNHTWAAISFLWDPEPTSPTLNLRRRSCKTGSRRPGCKGWSQGTLATLKISFPSTYSGPGGPRRWTKSVILTSSHPGGDPCHPVCFTAVVAQARSERGGAWPGVTQQQCRGLGLGVSGRPAELRVAGDC